jgi:hypothetical protein
MSDAVSKRVCLAGARTGDDEERSAHMAIGADAVLNRSTLLWIEPFEIWCYGRREHDGPPGANFTLDDSPWNRNEITTSQPCSFANR